MNQHIQRLLWCDAFMPTILPAAEEHVALYVISIAKDSKSSCKIQSAIHAFSWAHQLAGFKDPCTCVSTCN